MTLSERYQLKLVRFRLHQEQLLASKLERHKAAMLKQKQARDNKQRARYRDSRLQLLRLQGYRCAICRRHRDECGKTGLVADCFGRHLVRGLLCKRCDRILRVAKDNPSLVAIIGKYPYKLRKNAINYLEHWPSQKLDYMLFSQTPNPQLS